MSPIMYLVLVSNVNLFIMIFWHWKQVTSSDKNVLHVIYCALRYLYMYILKSSTKVLHITGYGKNRKNTLDISRLPLVLHAKPLGRAIGWVDFYVLYMLYNNLFPFWSISAITCDRFSRLWGIAMPMESSTEISSPTVYYLPPQKTLPQ